MPVAGRRPFRRDTRLAMAVRSGRRGFPGPFKTPRVKLTVGGTVLSCQLKLSFPGEKIRSLEPIITALHGFPPCQNLG